MARGDRGINPLDEACREHDIAYFRSQALPDRHKADEVLENKAWQRVKSADASLGERSAAWTITNTMKAKRKLGMGTKKCGGSFRKLVIQPISKSLQSVQGKGLSNTKKDMRKSSLVALRAARAAIKKAGGRKRIRVPRIIPLRKSGGILPLIPIFAGLSALGSLVGGASAVANAVVNAKNAKKKLEEDKRFHTEVMEEIGKKGSGLYLRKTAKGGYGLFLKKQKNFH